MTEVKVADFYDGEAASYHRQYDRANLMSLPSYPANFFRLQILLRRMQETRVTSVFEVGVGEGTPLTQMAAAGLRVGGNDIAQSMVETAKATFERNGLDPALISWGDLTDASTLEPHLKDGPFDAVVAAGVLPHVPDDEVALANMRSIIRPGGRMYVEFRNALFSLFTFNRYTRSFILDDLLKDVAQPVKDKVADAIDHRLALDQPPPRPYDSILARHHNPFELLELVGRSGFEEARVHWYHYHPAPPMTEPDLGQAFREAAMSLEHEGSWRGMFLCSAGVIEAVRT